MNWQSRSMVELGGLLVLGIGVTLLALRTPVVRADPPELPWSPSTEVEIANPTPTDGTIAEGDLEDVRKRKTLTVLAPYNSTTYFLYRGEPLGFEYELLRRFAKDHDLGLRVVVVRNGDELLAMLRRGEGDVAAARLVPLEETEAAQQGLAYTHSLYRTKPALVQQKKGQPEPNLPKPVDEVVEKKEAQGETADPAVPPEADGNPLRVRMITRPSQLAGKQVTLPKRSAYHRTLTELENDISGDIYVVDVEGVDQEALIERVAEGDVDLTVAQENLAELKESVYTNVVVIPTLGPSHPISWAVRKNSPELRAELDRWIDGVQDTSFFRELYRKYFVDRRRYRQRVKSEYLTSKTGRLCPYDRLLRRYAPELEWDWRLLASQAYQESKFDPRARSWAGASGLLQLMPATARQFGVRNSTNPDDNVRGGVEFLKWLRKFWESRIEDEDERLKFVLASYNAGPGHVQDAQRLAVKHGDNPKSWDDVAYWLLQLSQKRYYSDPVVRYGFVRGVEPVTYVGVILERYDHYRQFVEG